MAVGLQFFPWADSRAVYVSPALGTMGGCCSHHGSALAPQTGPAASCCSLLCLDLGHFLPQGVQRPLTLPWCSSEQGIDSCSSCVGQRLRVAGGVDGCHRLCLMVALFSSQGLGPASE